MLKPNSASRVISRITPNPWLSLHERELAGHPLAFQQRLQDRHWVMPKGMVSTTILGALGLQLKNIAAGVRKAIVSTRQPAATLCCLPQLTLGRLKTWPG
jgi:hypothetical protein